MDKRILEDGAERVLRIRAGEADRSYELRMISHSQPRELLPLRVSREQGFTDYLYTVTGLASLKDCEGKDSADYLYSVIFALERLGVTLGEHLLSPDRVLLDPELIYLKKETGTVSFCYFPGKEGSFQDALQSLMEYFLKIIEPLDEAEVLLLYGLYQKARESDVLPGTLANFWRENRGAERIREEETLSLSTRRETAVAEMPGREEQAVYRDLGLKFSEENRPFMKWRARQAPVPEEPAGLEELSVPEGGETEAELIHREKGLWSFLHKNAAALAAGAIVLSGILLFLGR